MELLIPGLALVALMVWASTRIKRNAAAAFEQETIETDEFIIQKPDGFLNNLNGDPKNTLEIYSKEYGQAATGTRAGRIRLTISMGNVDETVSSIKRSGDTVVDDITEVIGGRHYRLIETTRSENEAECLVTYKLAEAGANVYSLEAITLGETSDEFKGKMDSLVGSFELK